MERIGLLQKLLKTMSNIAINDMSKGHHLDGVRGGIAINESESMATTVLQ